MISKKHTIGLLVVILALGGALSVDAETATTSSSSGSTTTYENSGSGSTTTTKYDGSTTTYQNSSSTEPSSETKYEGSSSATTTTNTQYDGTTASENSSSGYSEEAKREEARREAMKREEEAKREAMRKEAIRREEEAKKRYATPPLFTRPTTAVPPNSWTVDTTKQGVNDTRIEFLKKEVSPVKTIQERLLPKKEGDEVEFNSDTKVRLDLKHATDLLPTKNDLREDIAEKERRLKEKELHDLRQKELFEKERMLKERIQERIAEDSVKPYDENRDEKYKRLNEIERNKQFCKESEVVLARLRNELSQRKSEINERFQQHRLDLAKKKIERRENMLRQRDEALANFVERSAQLRERATTPEQINIVATFQETVRTLVTRRFEAVLAATDAYEEAIALLKEQQESEISALAEGHRARIETSIAQAEQACIDGTDPQGARTKMKEAVSNEGKNFNAKRGNLDVFQKEVEALRETYKQSVNDAKIAFDTDFEQARIELKARFAPSVSSGEQE